MKKVSGYFKGKKKRPEKGGGDRKGKDSPLKEQ